MSCLFNQNLLLSLLEAKGFKNLGIEMLIFLKPNKERSAQQFRILFSRIFFRFKNKSVMFWITECINPVAALDDGIIELVRQAGSDNCIKHQRNGLPIVSTCFLHYMRR